MITKKPLRNHGLLANKHLHTYLPVIYSRLKLTYFLENWVFKTRKVREVILHPYLFINFQSSYIKYRTLKEKLSKITICK